MFTYSEEGALNLIADVLLLKSKKWDVFYLEDEEILKAVENFTEFNKDNARLYSVLSDGYKLDILTNKGDIKQKIIQKMRCIGFSCKNYHVDHSNLTFEKIN